MNTIAKHTPFNRGSDPQTIIARKPGVPSLSWWTETPEAEFHDRARQEFLQRMQYSKFGNAENLTGPEHSRRTR